MANLIFDKVQIEATIDKIVDRTMRMDMTWDWPCGVAYYGICEAYEVTKNERYLQLVKDRVDEYIELGLPRWTVNTCSMGHCLITLYQHTGDEKYLNGLGERRTRPRQRFQGTDRQVRGLVLAALRELPAGATLPREDADELWKDQIQLAACIASLDDDGLIEILDGGLRLPS